MRNEDYLERSELSLSQYITLNPLQERDIEIFDKRNLNIYPLINYTETLIHPFWVYLNVADAIISYKEEFAKDLIYNLLRLNFEISISLDYYIEFKDVFPFMVEFICSSNVGRSTIQKHHRFIQKVFLSKYIIDDGTILSKNFFAGKSGKIHPKSEQLDILVKKYLTNIDYNLVFDESKGEYVRKHSLMDDSVYSFFEYHLTRYKGEVDDFIKHAIELTRTVWKIGNSENRERKICFDIWLNEKFVQYPDLDRLKLKLESETMPEPLQQENAPVKNTTYYPASYTQIVPSIKIRPLWVYNNLIHIKGVAGESFELKKYKNDRTGEETIYVKGDDYRNRLDDFFGYIKQNISSYRMSIGFDLPKEEVPYDWDFNDEVFTILYFDISGYSDGETKLYKFDSSKQRLAKIGLNYGEKDVFCPDLTKLVRHKLKMIDNSDLDSFLNFHFSNCYDAFKFLVHVIEITDDIWENAQNDISCKKVFKKWVKEKIDFLEISNPQVLIDIYISQKRIEYDEKFIAQDFQGNVLLNEYGDSYSNAAPFEVFYNAKLEVKIYEFFQLNEKTTPEPPQPQQNNLENKKLTLTGSKVTIYHVFKQLIAKQIIGENAQEVAEFLIQNITGFENDSINYLGTEITRNRKTDLEKGNGGILKKNRIDLD